VIDAETGKPNLADSLEADNSNNNNNPVPQNQKAVNSKSKGSKKQA
jgi:hypothetical protein